MTPASNAQPEGICHRLCRVLSFRKVVFDKYVQLCTARPALLLFFFTSCFLTFTVLGLLVAGVPTIETDLTSGTYLRMDGTITDRYDNLQAAVEDDKMRRNAGGIRRLSDHWTGASAGEESAEVRRLTEQTHPRNSWATWQLDLYFHAKDGYAFHGHVLDNIRSFEEGIKALPSYERFCYRYQGRECRPFISSMRFFYGTVQTANTTNPYLWDPNVQYEITPDGQAHERNSFYEAPILHALMENHSWPGAYGPRTWYFDRHQPSSRRIRARAWFGTPLPGYLGPFDRDDEQLEEYQNFVEKELYPFLLEHWELPNVKVYWEGSELSYYEVLLAVGRDSQLALISLFLVWTFMASYTMAPLVAAMGMAVVVLGIPVGIVLFSLCGFDAFPVLNFLAFFLIIGIGADHLFVLVDAWRHAASEASGDETERLRITLSRAGKAVTACSLTTAASFLSNVFSAVRPLRWFGVFVGFCVLSNYILCVTMFPLILILRERGKGSCSCCRRKRLPHSLAEDMMGKTDSLRSDNGLLDNTKAQTAEANLAFLREAEARRYMKRKRCMETFFEDLYGPLLGKCPSLCILVGFLVTMGSLVAVTQVLELSEEPPEFFAAGTHNLGDAPFQKDYFGDQPWVQEMEDEALNVCSGCKWAGRNSDGELQVLPWGCNTYGFHCDMPACRSALDCTLRGECGQDGRCDCRRPYAGHTCEVRAADDERCGFGLEQEVCNGNGVCSDGVCQCYADYSGAKCQTRIGGHVFHCQWGEWTAWSECTADCGWGQKFRSRAILRQAQNGGEECSGSSSDHISCREQECERDCVWMEWSPWTNCSGKCGYGIQERTRNMEDARGEGQPCFGPSHEFQPCALLPCSDSCEYTSWVPTEQCSTTCGNGTITEERTLTASPANSTICEAIHYRLTPCNLGDCVHECNYSFGTWMDAPSSRGQCSVTCGEGTKWQVRELLNFSSSASAWNWSRYDDESCQGECCLGSDNPLRRREVRCSDLEFCPISCSDSAYDSWGDWSACTATCGQATRMRSRTGGVMCLEQTQHESCNLTACVHICDTLPWHDADACSVTCGEGTQSQARHVPEEHVDLCRSTRSIPCTVDVPCPVPCLLGEWVNAGACSVSCGWGAQQRIRRVVQQAAHGAEPCPNPMSLQMNRSFSCYSGIPCPNVVFTLQLHGQPSGSLDPDEEDALKHYLATLLGVPVEDVLLDVAGNSRRRLQNDLQEHEAVTVSILHTDHVDLTQVEVNLHAALNGQEGFEELSHISKTVHANGEPEDVEERPQPTTPDRRRRGSNQYVNDDTWQREAEELEEGQVLPESRVAIVSVVFGLKSEAPSKGAALGKPGFAPFTFSLVQAQEAVRRTCEEGLRQQERLAIRRAKCIVTELEKFLQELDNPITYPVVPGVRVHGHLQDFLSTSVGLDWQAMVGFTNNLTVHWMQVQFVTNLPKDMPAADAWKWLGEWDSFIVERNAAESGTGVGTMYHTSELWVRVETEIGLITSTLVCVVVSVSASFLTVALLLGNLALSIYVILGIICVVLCLCALMFGMLGWKLGAVEAVSLIVFVGFSVDYLLHIAESFSQSNLEGRKARVKDALRRTGGAVLAAAATSVLAGIPILWCLIQVFIKIGITVIANTFISVIFALGFFPALLMLVGPERGFGVFSGALWKRRQQGEVDEPATAVGTVIGVGTIGQGPNYAWSIPTASSGAGGYKWSSYDDDGEKKKSSKEDPQKNQRKVASLKCSTGSGTLVMVRPAEVPAEGDSPPHLVTPTSPSPPMQLSPATLGKTSEGDADPM